MDDTAGAVAESAASAQPASPAITERNAVIASVRTALDAWEGFARSADLDDVDEAFAVDGPQYRQFAQEAGDGTAGVERVPDFSLQSVDAVEPDGRRYRVVAQVALTVQGNPPDVREWEFVLKNVDGSWRVWTVIDQTG